MATGSKQLTALLSLVRFLHATLCRVSWVAKGCQLTWRNEWPRFLATSWITARTVQGRQEASAAGVTQSVLLPLALAGAILVAVVRNGRGLVNKPQLCPKLVQPW